jgi:CheY-like chemotaxis protein
MNEAEDAPAAAGRDAQGRGAAILVVEDEALIRMVIADHLRDLGYEVAETRSADEAVALLEKGRDVDLVFSDVNLPGAMNGIDLARWLRAHRPAMPVLLTSGAIAVQDMPADLRGSCDLVLKPYDIEEVARRIGLLLAGAATGAAG